MNFGAMDLKIWIFEHLNHFLEMIFLKNNSNPPRDQLGAPGAVHPRSLTSGPAGQSAERGELRRAGAHLRQSLSANQVAVHALRLKANLAHPFARPETDRSRLATGHGRAAALLTVVPRRWPGRARLEWLASIVVPRRARRAN